MVTECNPSVTMSLVIIDDSLISSQKCSFNIESSLAKVAKVAKVARMFPDF